MTKVDRYLIPGNNKFVLQFGHEVKVEVVDTKVLGQRSYGTIHRCRILGQEPYVDPDVDCVVKRFQTTGLAECDKLVPFTNHPGIIKPFPAQFETYSLFIFPYLEWKHIVWSLGNH